MDETEAARTPAPRRASCALAGLGLAALLAVVPVPALAQGAAPQPAAPAVPAAPAESGTPATVVDDDQIESVLGQKVQTPAGEDLGRIVDILVDRTGAIRAAVIDFGGFFGVGSRKIAVDWRSLHINAAAKVKTVVADLAPDRLRMSPIYKEGEPVVIPGRGEAGAKAAAPAEAAVPVSPAAAPASTTPKPPPEGPKPPPSAPQ